MIVIDMLHDNLLALPIKTNPITDTLNQELKEYQNNCKAVYFHVVNLLKKTWKAIHEQKDNTLQLAYFFGKLCDGVTQMKADKIRQNRMKQVIITMRDSLQAKKMRKRKRELALQQSQINKLRKVFKEWKCINALQLSTKTLKKFRLAESFKEFLMLLRQNKQRRAINRLSTSQNQVMHSVYANSLRKMAFKGLIINYKMNRVQKMLKITKFISFKQYLISYNKNSKKYYRYRHRKLLSSCFASWKNCCKQSMADRFRKLYILARCFETWRDNLEYLICERQLQKQNDRIVTIFREKKQKQHLLRMLYGWRQQAKQMKDLKIQNSIVNKFAGLKYREIVLRRYFEMLKANCINNKIKNQFYQLKLKRKAVEGLKIAICQSLQKEERIITFMEKVERKKYFDRIIRFNRDQRKKVEKFRLSKMFNAFSLSIVYEYYHKLNKASSYYQHNLMFKSVFALKNEVSFSKRASFCIIYLNAIRPLRRWTQSHRAINYQKQREWLLLKKIFREWRLLIVRASSAKKLTKQFSIEDSIKPSRDDSRMQAFEFDNIMATIAKIRKNFITEKQETLKNQSGHWVAVQTPSQELDFSLSKQNLQEGSSL